MVRIAIGVWSGVILAAAGCGVGDAEVSAICADANAHVAACLGTEVGAGCDASSAEAALAMSCEEIADGASKADCTPFTWWECGLGGGSGSRDEETRLYVQNCLGEFCEGYTAAPCARVVVETEAGGIAAEAWSSEHGSVRVALRRGERYTARVLLVDGTNATLASGDFVQRQSTSIAFMGGASRVDLNLVRDQATRLCAAMDVRMNVLEPGGAQVAPAEIEWDWIAVISDDKGAQVGKLHRAYRSFGQAGDYSSFTEHYLYPGRYDVAFHRVSIPTGEECSWRSGSDEPELGWGSGDRCRLPNRNRALFERFRVSGVDPIRASFEVEGGHVGGRGETEIFLLEDPTPGR